MAGERPAPPDEAAIRRALGVGGTPGGAIDPDEVERLIRGALEAHGEVLGGAGPAGAGDAPPLVDRLELLRDVHLPVQVELGRARMRLEEILRLRPGSVVELERLAGDPLDISVNDRVIARGEVLVLHESFCIRITQVLHPEEIRRGA